MRVVATILLLCAFFPLCAQQAKNDLRRQKLRGSVSMLTEYEYAAVPGSSTTEKGELKTKSVWTYNNVGNCIKFETFSAAGKLMSQSVFVHADTGTEVKRYRGDGGLNVTTNYKYDKAGNESQESNYDPTGTLFMTAKSKFDLNGNRIVYDRHDQYGHLFLRSNIRYDKRGNEIQEREFDSHESLQYTTTYEYQGYDKEGNWLKRVMLKNNEPRTITEREITY
jgi:antitoxin component YwqK of YwqJK toxin-antitoxin module